MEAKRRVRLTRRKRKELRDIVRRGKSENRMAMRARIVLLAWEKKAVSQIARLVGVSRETVRKWINRYREDGVDGLRDKARAGRPPKFTPNSASG